MHCTAHSSWLNAKVFHDKSGKGYTFLADLLLEIDSYNPSVSIKNGSAFNGFSRYDEERKAKMLGELKRMSEQKLSKDLFEKVTAALN